MTPIPFYVFPRAEVARIAPLSATFLRDWEAVRPGVLDDNSIDVFLPNIRSERHTNTRFDLFQRVENVDSGTVIVCNSWLELLEADGVRHYIETLMGHIRSLYPHNPKVWSWNNDRDQVTVPELQDLPDNEFVLAYNTSKPAKQDILVPCWNVECRSQWNPQDDRPMRGGFIGYVGGVKVRQAMYNAFVGKPLWDIRDTDKSGRLAEEKYLELMRHWDFSLCPRGGGISSYRFWESLQQGAIPILFADDVWSGTVCTLPFPDLQWDQLIVHLPEQWAASYEAVMKTLFHSEVGDIDVKAYRERIAAVRERFGLAGVQKCIFERISEYLQ